MKLRRDKFGFFYYRDTPSDAVVVLIVSLIAGAFRSAFLGLTFVAILGAIRSMVSFRTLEVYAARLAALYCLCPTLLGFLVWLGWPSLWPDHTLGEIALSTGKLFLAGYAAFMLGVIVIRVAFGLGGMHHPTETIEED